MATILDTIAGYARARVAADMETNSRDVMQMLAQSGGIANGAAFDQALRKEGMSFICEVKKASPSKGVISKDFPYLDIARAYEAAGADCISCLTEPKWFLGSDQIFGEIRAAVSLPMLRKDFVVDDYQIYQAKVMGANCVLLICALLDGRTLRDWRELAESLGMSALVEAHDEDEVRMALDCGAKIIGVNNRNLKDFTVDVHNSARYRAMVPNDVLFVSESGISTRADIEVLEQNGTNAVLIGETLMRAGDKKNLLDTLRGRNG